MEKNNVCPKKNFFFAKQKFCYKMAEKIKDK